MSNGDHFGETQDGPERERSRRAWEKESREREAREAELKMLRTRIDGLEAEVERLHVGCADLLIRAVTAERELEAVSESRRKVWEERDAAIARAEAAEAREARLREALLEITTTTGHAEWCEAGHGGAFCRCHVKTARAAIALEVKP